MDQLIDVKTLIVVIGLAQTLITIGGVFGLLKFRVNDHHKTLYGNGRPGVVNEVNDIKSDIRSIKEHCEIQHPKNT
jgi:hypothetical protein